MEGKGAIFSNGTSIDFHKIHPKFQKLLRTQAEALQLPTFSEETIDQITNILEHINKFENNSHGAVIHTRDFAEMGARYIPKLTELAEQNFLPQTISTFQEILSTIHETVNDIAQLPNLSSEHSSILSRVMTLSKSIIPKVFMVLYRKSSPTTFPIFHQSLQKIQNDLNIILYDDPALSDYFPLLKIVSQALKLCDHISSVHSFVYVSESLQNTLRKVPTRTVPICFPFKNTTFNLIPSIPGDIETSKLRIKVRKTKKVQENEETQEDLSRKDDEISSSHSIDDLEDYLSKDISELLNELKEDPTKHVIHEAITQKIDDQAKFPSQIPMIISLQEFLQSMKLKVPEYRIISTIHKFAGEFIRALSSLPDHIYSLSDLIDFRDSAVDFSEYLSKYLRAPKYSLPEINVNETIAKRSKFRVISQINLKDDENIDNHSNDSSDSKIQDTLNSEDERSSFLENKEEDKNNQSDDQLKNESEKEDLESDEGQENEIFDDNTAIFKIYSKHIQVLKQFQAEEDFSHFSIQELLKKLPFTFNNEAFHDFINFEKKFFATTNAVFELAKNIDDANSILEKRFFFLDISTFKPTEVQPNFWIPINPSNENVQKLNIMRSFAMTSQLFQKLKEGVFKSSVSQSSKTLTSFKPINFAEPFRQIHLLLRDLETYVFHLSFSGFNEFPVSKSGVTILSVFTEFQNSLDLSLLHMELFPAQMLSLRSTDFCLLNEGMDLQSDPDIQNVFKIMIDCTRCYQIYSMFDNCGVSTLTTCAHMSFLVTIITEISKIYPEFEPFAKKFSSYDLFHLNVTDLMEQLNSISTLAQTTLSKCTTQGFVTRFNKFTKTIYTCASAFKRISGNQLLIKLISQLSSWLGNLSRTLPKQTNLREMQIRMSVMLKLVNNFIKGNPDFKSHIPYDNLLEAVALFGELRDAFLTKTRLKMLLTFIERVQISGRCLTPISISTEEEEGLENDQGRTDDSEFPLKPEEKAKWFEFSKTVLVRQQKDNRPLPFISSLDPKKIITDFKTFLSLIENWARNQKFSEIFSDFIKKISFPDLEHQEKINLKEIFQAAWPSFLDFRHKANEFLCNEFDLLIEFSTQLYPNKKPQREKSFTGDLKIINAMNDLLTRMKNLRNKMNVPDNDSTLFVEIADIFKQYIIIVENDKRPLIPIADFRSFVLAYFIYNLVYNTFYAFSDHPIDFSFFVSMIRALLFIGKEVQNKHKSHSESEQALNVDFIIERQIWQMLESGVGSDPFYYEKSLNTFEKSISIFNLMDIVHRISHSENESGGRMNSFFDFKGYISSLPPRITSIPTMLSSSLQMAHEEASLFLFNCLIDPKLIPDAFSSLSKFESQFSVSPVKPDLSHLMTIRQSLRLYQTLFDTALVFDLASYLLPQKHPDTVSGILILRLKIILTALEDHSLSLGGFEWAPNVQEISQMIDCLPHKFGSVSRDKCEIIGELFQKFIKNQRPIIPNQLWDKFARSVDDIFNLLTTHQLANIAKEELDQVSTLDMLVKEYNITHNTDLLHRIRLGFNFLDAIIQRQGNESDDFYAPFVNLYSLLDKIQILIETNKLINVAATIVTEITSKPLSSPPNFIQYSPIRLYTESSKLNANQAEKISITQQLPLDQQTVLGTMTSELYISNMRVEKLLANRDSLEQLVIQSQKEIPLLQHQVEALEDFNSFMKEHVQLNKKDDSEQYKEMKEKLLKETKEKADISTNELNDLDLRYKTSRDTLNQQKKIIFDLQKKKIELGEKINKMNVESILKQTDTSNEQMDQNRKKQNYLLDILHDIGQPVSEQQNFSPQSKCINVQVENSGQLDFQHIRKIKEDLKEECQKIKVELDRIKFNKFDSELQEDEITKYRIRAEKCLKLFNN